MPGPSAKPGAKAPQPSAAAPEDQLRLTIPSDTGYLHLVANFARNGAETAGLSEADAENVALATVEAVTNVIEHAYRGQRDRSIELLLRLLPGGIEVHVIHDGEPIDAAVLGREFDPRALLKGGKKGGLGVVLMRRLMDGVDFGSTGDARSECCLRKLKRDDPSAPTPPREGPHRDSRR